MTAELAPRPDSAVRGYLFLTFLCIGSLFALFGLRQFLISPAANPVHNGAWFAVQVLPLLALLPGLLRANGRRGRLIFFITSLMGMLYFVLGVWAVASPEMRTWGLWVTGFSLILVALGSLGTRAIPAPAP